MGNQNQAVATKFQSSLFETSVELEAVGAIFNVTNEDVEGFVENYLKNIHGIKGVNAVRCNAVREGDRPEIAIYVFFDLDSPDIQTGNRNVLAHLRGKMDVGGLRATSKLHEALRPLVRKDYKLHARVERRTAFIKLDTFNTVGLLVGADKRQHNVFITEAKELKKHRAAFTVLKRVRQYQGDNNLTGVDHYSQMVRDLEN